LANAWPDTLLTLIGVGYQYIRTTDYLLVTQKSRFGKSPSTWGTAMKAIVKLAMCAAAASTMCLFAISTACAAWPDDQPIRIIVPQAVGGTNDTVARLIGVELGKRLKQTVVIENRPGASGAIGMQATANARPDGYTLAVASDSASLIDVTRPDLPWKFKRDLRGVAMIGDQPISVAVSARSPYMSIQDIVKAARQTPDKIAYGMWSANGLRNWRVSDSFTFRTRAVVKPSTTFWAGKCPSPYSASLR
jgi:tripartite-type tricarboxylate transporter receptor subunit TctC